MEINVVRWHGDAPQGAKQRTLKRPSGVALITPESIEALFLRRTTDARNMFGAIDVIVIDELHAFLQGPRGLHLASLLNRIDAMAGRRARRIGLSATIGDPDLAARWMNPSDADSVVRVMSTADAPELRLQIRGYIEPPEKPKGSKSASAEEPPPPALEAIADHAFSVLRGANNLFFGGSRRNVEALADALRARSENHGVPNEFFPHHGSISKELREELEKRLKDGSLPTTAVATTTLELGIDIGSVRSVAALGAPRSLASLRQRLGRSGRRKGVPAIMRMYVREAYPDPGNHPMDRLRLETVRAVAATRLLIDKFVEPPSPDPAVYSVLVHQTLALIVQLGGAKADVLHQALCSTGPLASVSAKDYAALLRAMAGADAKLIEQAPNGLVMLGEAGEKLSSGRDFYSVFESDEEWKLFANGRPLGTIPLSNAIGIGHLVIFAGQRWRVVSVDDRSKVLEVTAHRAGVIPRFDRLAVESIHDRLASEMRDVLMTSDIAPYLDQTAVSQLEEGRAEFTRCSLAKTNLIEHANDTVVMTWRGTLFNDAIAALLVAAGLECETLDVGVTVSATKPSELASLIGGMSRFPTADDLSGFIGNLRSAKFDGLVPDELLQQSWADRMRVVCEQLPSECERLFANHARTPQAGD